MQLENHPLDRKTIISQQEDDYVINRVITQGDDVQRSSRSITLENMQGFVSEGMYPSNSTPLLIKFKPASLKPYSIALQRYSQSRRPHGSRPFHDVAWYNS